MENNFVNTDNNIVGNIINDIYTDIGLSKKFIFDFKLSFLNNNFNTNLETIAIKKIVLFNLFDSFELTIKNIKKKIIKLQKEINNIFKSNTLSNNNYYDINKSTNYKNQILQHKLNYNMNNNNNDLNDNGKNSLQNINITNFLDISNHINPANTYRKELYTSKININSNNSNKNIYNEIYQENNRKKNNNNNTDIYNPRIQGKIIKKINSFNTENKNNNCNNYENTNNSLMDKTDSIFNKTNKSIKDYNYPYINNIKQNKEMLIKNNSAISENLKYKNYLKKINMSKDSNTSNNNYYKMEQTPDINKDSDIKIKSPIREVIKKLIKNKNQINESFSNFCSMTYGIQNKSFDLNDKNNKGDSLIERIKNSENLYFYFSEKYGDGDFNTFLNNYKKNKISHQLVDKEISVLDKIIDNNNNTNVNNKNINNFQNDNYKKNFGKSTDLIKNNKNAPYRTMKNKTNVINRTFNQFEKKQQKKYRTDTPSNRGYKKNNNEKNNLSNKIRNTRGHQISSSVISNYLKTDESNNKMKNIIPHNYILENKNNFTYKRFKTPINQINNIRNYSFI